jgi:G3E family GTPase
VIDASTFGTDWFSWNAAGERTGWVVPGDECAATRKVAELLAEQVEAADILIVNKIDLAGPEQTKVAMEVAMGINSQSNLKTISETAKVFTSSWGQVPFEVFLGLEADKNTVSPTEKTDACDEPECTDTSHSHDHAEHACSEPDCTDTSHNHDHNEQACSEPACTDTSHSHEHGHAHNDEDAACADATCDDPTHDHSHNHNHASSTATSDLGISSFVYKSPHPFNSGRLMALLNKWPVPLKEELDLELMKAAAKEGFEVEDGMSGDSPFAGVLRSKGFCWLAPTKWSQDPWRHDTAMYWSHAGKHFGIQTAGKWWGSMSKEQMERFGSINPKEFERIRREDFVSEEWGDRRQELVFIGVELSEDTITNALNDCLMNDEELEMYRVQAQNLMNSLMSKEDSSSGPSLMDVGSTDHIDAPSK